MIKNETIDPRTELEALLNDAFARLHGTNHCIYVLMQDLVDAFRSSLHRIDRLVKAHPTALTDDLRAKLTSVRDVSKTIHVPPSQWDSGFYGVPKREVDRSLGDC